jgi:hypothetical protein
MIGAIEECSISIAPNLPTHRDLRSNINSRVRCGHCDPRVKCTRLTDFSKRKPEPVSSSIVSMRFLVRAPVSSMVRLPILPKRGSTVGSFRLVALPFKTPRGPNFARNLRRAHLLGVDALAQPAKVRQFAGR